MKRLLVILALTLALLGTVFVATPANANENNVRWPSGTVCLVDRTTGNVRDAVAYFKKKANDYTYYTGVKFVRKPKTNPNCTGYKNRVILKDSWWSGTDRAKTTYTGNEKYGWTYKDDAWVLKSPVTTSFNRRYGSSVGVWKWVVAHEALHFVVYWKHLSWCSTVLRSSYSSYTSSCPAPSFWTYADRKLVRAWYG